MLIAITSSIIPFMFVEETIAFRVIEIITISFFILDNPLRWITASYLDELRGFRAEKEDKQSNKE